MKQRGGAEDECGHTGDDEFERGSDGCCVLFLVGGCRQGTLKKLKKEWDAQKKLHDKFLDKSAAGGATAAPLAANGAGDSN